MTSFARLFLTTIPPINKVEELEPYGFLNGLTGTLVVSGDTPGNYPSVGQVLAGIVFGDANELTGTYVTTATGDVRDGVLFGPNGSLIGTLEGGSPAPPPADMCNVSVFVRKHVGGDAFAGVSIEARHPTGLAIKGSAVSLNSTVTGTTNEAGFVLLVLSRQAKYRLSFKGKEGTTFSVDITVPNTESATIEQAL